MDSSIFIALIIIGLAILIFVPVSLINRRDRNRRQIRQRTIIQQIANDNKLNITQQDVWNDQLLGMDDQNKLIVYCDLEAINPSANIIHFSEVDSAAVVKNTERIQHAGRNRTSPEIHISDISIELYSAKRETLLECVFYDDIKNSLSQIPELTEKAKDWLQQLSTLTPVKISDKTI